MSLSQSLLILLCISTLSFIKSRSSDEKFQQLEQQPFKQELAKQMIPENKLSKYRQIHDQMTEEIERVAPSLRQVQTSIETFTLHRDSGDFIIQQILHHVATDLGTHRLDDQLIDMFEKGSKYAKLRAKEHKKEYSRISLSYSHNQETFIIVGAVGFRKKDDDPDAVEFGYTLYQERWKESLVEVLKRWWSWGHTVGYILKDSDVKMYAMYRLYDILNPDTCTSNSCVSSGSSSMDRDSHQKNNQDKQATIQESELASWLSENNYQDVIPIFEQETITLEELIEMGEDDAIVRQYLQDINIPDRYITRITFRLKKMFQRRESTTKKGKTQRQSFIKQELAELMIEDRQIPKYKKIHDKISNAITGIAPSSRIIKRSIEVTVINRNEIDRKLPQLLLSISTDLGCDLDEELKALITKRAKKAEKGLRANKKEYARVSLSRRFDKETYFIVGAAGFRAIEKNVDEIEFGVTLYQERWMENWREIVTRWLKFGETASGLLNESDVEKFAMYRLYLELV